MKRRFFYIVICILALLPAVSSCGVPGTPEAESELPASEIEVLSMDLSSAEVELGETVLVMAEIYNAGQVEGTYTAILQLDGAEKEQIEVLVGKGASETVTFYVRCTLGAHELRVGKVGVTVNVTPTKWKKSLNYFQVAEGHGVKYHVTDDHDGLDCDVWAISQHFEPDTSFRGDYMFTLIGEESAGEDFQSNGLVGWKGSRMSNDGNVSWWTSFTVGFPVSNQGYFYRNFSLLCSFKPGDEWTVRKETKYTVENVETQTIGGVEFDDCIRVNIDDSANSSEYLKGSGYFILARDIGIVQLVFNRNSGTVVEYEYIEHKQFISHSISGTITDMGEPLAGVAVQLANGNCGTRSLTDSNGAFTIEAYGPDVVLRIGYDKDDDNVLDYYDPDLQVKEYRLSGVTSDVSGLIIACASKDAANIKIAYNPNPIPCVAGYMMYKVIFTEVNGFGVNLEKVVVRYYKGGKQTSSRTYEGDDWFEGWIEDSYLPAYGTADFTGGFPCSSIDYMLHIVYGVDDNGHKVRGVGRVDFEGF